MEDFLIEILESLGLPVYRQGSMTEKTYPESFFTFWNTESPDHAYYDNKDYGTEWAFMVNCYSSDPAVPYEKLMEARRLLKQNEWTVPGKGYDVYSDEPTHTGRGMTIYFLETDKDYSFIINDGAKFPIAE